MKKREVTQTMNACRKRRRGIPGRGSAGGKARRSGPRRRRAGSLQEVRFRKERKCGGRAVGRGGRKLRRRQVTADGQQPGESLRKTAEHRGMWNVPWLRDDEFWARTVHGQPSAFGNTLSGSEHRVLKWGPATFQGPRARGAAYCTSQRTASSLLRGTFLLREVVRMRESGEVYGRGLKMAETASRHR